MGNAVSDLREEDIAQLRLSQTLGEWLTANSQYTEFDEKLDDYFFVYSFNSGYRATSRTGTIFPWLPRIFLVTSHQLVVLRVSHTNGLREERAVTYTDIEDVFFAPAYHLVKLSFTDGSVLYFSTAREDLPEQVVAVVSRNLNTFRSEIIHVMRARQARLARLRTESKAEASLRAVAEAAADEEALQAAAAENWNAKSVVESFYQEQIRELAEVWAELPALGIRELQLWEGSIDLRALLYTLRTNRRRPLPEDPTSQFLVSFRFIPASNEFGYLEHRVYRVRNDESTTTMVEQLCAKLMVANPERFGLRTTAGLELQPNLTFADYGLGTLFLTWKVEMFFLEEQQNDTFLVQFMLPDEPEFMGTNKKLMKLTRTTTIAEALDLMCRKLRIPNDNKYKLQHQGLEMQLDSTLREHGLGSLFDSTKKMVIDVVFNEDVPSTSESESPRSRGNTSEDQSEGTAATEAEEADEDKEEDKEEGKEDDEEKEKEKDTGEEKEGRTGSAGAEDEKEKIGEDQEEKEEEEDDAEEQAETKESPQQKAAKKPLMISKSMATSHSQKQLKKANRGSWCVAQPSGFADDDEEEGETVVQEVDFAVKIESEEEVVVVKEEADGDGPEEETENKAEAETATEQEVETEAETVVVEKDSEAAEAEAETAAETEEQSPDADADADAGHKRSPSETAELLREKKEALVAALEAMSLEELERAEALLSFRDSAEAVAVPEQEEDSEVSGEIFHKNFSSAFEMGVGPADEQGRVRLTINAQETALKTFVQEQAGRKLSDAPDPEVSEFLTSLFDRLVSYGVNPEEVEGLAESTAAQQEASSIALAASAGSQEEASGSPSSVKRVASQEYKRKGSFRSLSRVVRRGKKE
mmetsp:Transcript_11323/g.45996  ORF Transcript_11323/g.45996 Transcript_11323/m.45996 type:complete len:870 (+) Transcript_11323:19-2628(+)